MGATSSVSNNFTKSDLKINGDAAFQTGNYNKAISYYTQCVMGHNVHVHDNMDLAKVFSNRSAAYLENMQYENALEDALTAIDLFPSWAKGYYRAAQASINLGETGKNEAFDFIEKALSLAPNNATIIELREKLLSGYVPRSREVGYCCSWGIGNDGQLGHNSKTNLSLPKIIDIFRGKYIIDVACGVMHTVAVAANGDAYSWGNNTHSQCGLISVEALILVPKLIPKLVGIFICAVSCGAGHTVVVATDGRAFSWGVGRQGQLGHGNDFNNEGQPRHIESLKDQIIIAVACGIAHTIVLLEDGSIRSHGLNNYGQLGLGSGLGPMQIQDEEEEKAGGGSRSHSSNIGIPTCVRIRVPVPVHVPRIIRSSSDIDGNGNDDINTYRISHISCGGAHSLIVIDGKLFTCGSNSCGQLGLGNSRDYNEFTRIESVAAAVSFAYVSCGEEFSLAITSDGKDVYTWGLGIAGQLGNGTLTNSTTPNRVEINDNTNANTTDVISCTRRFETASCSQGQVLAITTDGEVWTWGLPGDRAQAAFQDASLIMRKPERVTVISSKKKRVRQLSCGRKHYVVLYEGVYAPYCTIDIEDNIEVMAGKWQKFNVQSRNIRDEICESGGCIFSYHLLLIEPDDNNNNNNHNQNSSTNNTNTNTINTNKAIELDDDMNGKYTGRFKSTISGIYHLKISLYGHAIQRSPIVIRILPERPFAAGSTVQWGVQWQCTNNNNNEDEDVSHSSYDVKAKSSEIISFRINLQDKYGNECKDINGYEVQLQCVDKDGKCIISEHIECNTTTATSITGNMTSSSSLCSGSFRCPVEPGRYTLSLTINDGIGIGINSYDDHVSSSSCIIHGTAYNLLVESIDTYPGIFQVTMPSSYGTVGEDFTVFIQLSRMYIDILGAIDMISTGTLNTCIQCRLQPLESHISARALVRQSSTSASTDVLHATYGEVVWDNRSKYIVRSRHNSHIAGNHLLTISLTATGYDSVEIYTSIIRWHAGRAHEDYTEIVHLNDLLRLINNNNASSLSSTSSLSSSSVSGNNSVDVQIQTRDRYGNPCEGHHRYHNDYDEKEEEKEEDIKVWMWIQQQQHEQPSLRHTEDIRARSELTVRKDVTTAPERGHGLYTFTLPPINRNEVKKDEELSLIVHLNGKDIMYSPFLLFSSQNHDILNNQYKTTDIEEMSKVTELSMIANKESTTINELKSNGSLHNHLTLEQKHQIEAEKAMQQLAISQIRREALTHKRAQDALKKEQMRIREEKEKQRRKSNAKRTGGGNGPSCEGAICDTLLASV
eukprot:gene7795-15945_t